MKDGIILIVDDELSVRRSLKSWLKTDYAVETAKSGEEGLKMLGKHTVSLILLDQRLPGISGLEVLKRVATQHSHIPVIMMTGFGAVEQAVEAIKLGASDYLLKPVDLDLLKIRIDRLVEINNLSRENQRLKRELGEKFSYHNLLTADPMMQKLCQRIEAVAQTDAPILITGESGTGKEVVARAIHLASQRADKPFVAVACGAIPETLLESELFGHEKGSFTGALERRKGKFEEAEDGTILLDEIGELSPMAQVKFLRILQELEFQRIGSSQNIKIRARIISATNKIMEESVETSEFRQDLFYRINTIHLTLPPLRNRQGDVPLLALHFMNTFAKKYKKNGLAKISPETMGILQAYSWPGNIRELRGVMEQASIICSGSAIEPTDLPEYLQNREEKSTGKDFHQRMDDTGRKIIMEALGETEGNKKKAAELLGMSQRALSHYLKKYGIPS